LSDKALPRSENFQFLGPKIQSRRLAGHKGRTILERFPVGAVWK
jgi:hypothetical protein